MQSIDPKSVQKLDQQVRDLLRVHIQPGPLRVCGRWPGRGSEQRRHQARTQH